MALWISLPPFVDASSSITSACVQLDIVIDLQRCEKAWCALLQSEQMKILNFMHTSLKPILSSWVHVAHDLFAASLRRLLRCFM